jgi:hypothetical protein
MKEKFLLICPITSKGLISNTEDKMPKKAWPEMILFVLCIFIMASVVQAQGLRKAVWAGQFYEADPVRLSQALDAYLESAPVKPVSGQVVGLISPHAGYVYSGRVAAFGYRLTKGQLVKSVIIIGPSHQYGFQGCSIYLEGGFETPLGVVEVDDRLAKELARNSGFGYIPEAHAKEHSVEVQIPFIQKVLPGARIVPVVMGFQTEETIRTLASALAKILPGTKSLVVASTDMSHFLTREKASELDQKTIGLIKAVDIGTLMPKVKRAENIMCGGGPVLALLLYAQQLGQAKVEVLSYSDSAAVGGPEDRVVGYLSAAVYLDNQPELMSLTPEEKKELLTLARKAIEVYLDSGKLLNYHAENPKYSQPAGAFVSLKEGNVLRGCIGFAEPVYPLWQTVVQSAVLAASEDPRFLPLKQAELPKLEIEISVLGPLQPVVTLSEIKIGQHGLLIKEGQRSGLLLPQVATEFGWDRQAFLRELCRKAGLPEEAYRNLRSLYKFEAIVFKE